MSDDKFNKIILKNIKQGRTLDIGCGHGHFLKLFTKENIIGIDSNLETTKLLIKDGWNCVKAKVPPIPFPDNYFDNVNCSHIIEHLPFVELHNLLIEIDRVLVNGGTLNIQAPLLWNGFYEDITHIKPYYPKSITNYLLKNPPIIQSALPKISNNYKVILCKYRYGQLFRTDNYSKYKIYMNSFFNKLTTIGIHSLKKTGYLLILKKGD